MKLTAKMVSVLERIEELKRRFGTSDGCKGMFPTGGAWGTIRALERHGLVRHIGNGIDIDGEVDGEVDIYDTTAKGRSELVKSHRKEPRHAR